MLAVGVDTFAELKARKEVKDLELELVLAYKAAARAEQPVELKDEDCKDTVNYLKAVKVEEGSGRLVGQGAFHFKLVDLFVRALEEEEAHKVNVVGKLLDLDDICQRDPVDLRRRNALLAVES